MRIIEQRTEMGTKSAASLMQSASSSSSSVSRVIDESHAPTSVRLAPKLEGISQYGLWRRSMENYLTEKKLDDILKMKISSWKSMCDRVDLVKMNQNATLFAKLGITLMDKSVVPKVKLENNC